MTTESKAILMTDADHRRVRSLIVCDPHTDDGPLAALQRRARSARVVGPRDIPRNVVTMNSQVILRNLDSGDRMTCTLAYPGDARLFRRMVPVTSALGTAMLGKRVGQIIRWPAGARDRRLRIQSVVYQPEAAGHFQL